MPISERLRRLGKAAAIGWFGFFVFAVVFYLSLPYTRFKDSLAAQLALAGYELEAKHAGPSLGLGMKMEEVTLLSQSAGAAKPTRILIESATLNYSILSHIFGTKSYGIDLDVFGGEIGARFKSSKSATAARLRATEIDLAEMPWLKNAINLPASGKMDIKLDIDLPKQRASEAKGRIEWSCATCAIGDGKAKLTIASHPLLAEGLGLPKIRLGDFTGKVVIDKGVGRLQGVSFKSQDLEASIEGEIHLAQPFGTSRVDLYVRFKLSDSLLRSSEKLRMIMDLTAQMGKRPDGFLGFRATGSFQNMSNVQWLKTSPFTAAAIPKPAPPPAKVAPPPPPAIPAPLPPPAIPAPPPPPAIPAPAPPPPPAPPAPAAAPPAPAPAPATTVPPPAVPPPPAPPAVPPTPATAPPAPATAPPPPATAPPAPGTAPPPPAPATAPPPAPA